MRILSDKPIVELEPLNRSWTSYIGTVLLYLLIILWYILAAGNIYIYFNNL